MTRFILLILLISFASVASQAFQSESILTLPKVEDVKTIKTKDNKYHYRYYTPSSLLRIFPHLIAGTVKPKDDPEFQYGTITTKDGTILNWRASNEYTLVIYNGNLEWSFRANENYSKEQNPISIFLLKVASLFIFLLWVIVSAFFYDYRHKNPDSWITRIYNLIFVRLALRLLFASLAFYLAYQFFLEPLLAIKDGVIRDEFLAKGGGWVKIVEFSDSNPATFYFLLIWDSIPSIIMFAFGLITVFARPRATYWLAKLNARRKLPENNRNTLIEKGQWK